MGSLRSWNESREKAAKYLICRLPIPASPSKARTNGNRLNAELANGMNQLISALKDKKEQINHQRSERGMNKKFSNLPSKALPNR
jgi:hypothetical protein